MWWRILSAEGLSPVHRVDPPPRGLLGPVAALGYALHGSLCTSQDYRLHALVPPFPDPRAIATDAFLFWDHMELYAFPPFPASRHLLQTLVITGDVCHTLCPILAEQGVVPRPAAGDCQCSLPPADLPRSLTATTITLLLTTWKLFSFSSALRAFLRELQHSWRDLGGVH